MDSDLMQAAADRVGAKLDALDLDAEEREVLRGDPRGWGELRCAGR